MFEADGIEIPTSVALTITTLLAIAKFTFASSAPWWFVLMPIWFPLLVIGIWTIWVILVIIIKDLIWWWR